MLTATNQSTGDFEPISAGVHLAVCCGIVDLGNIRSEFKGKEKIQRKVQVLFEIPDEVYEDENGEEHPRTISSRYTMSLNPKSTLYKVLKTWTGADPGDSFDLRKVLKKGCQLSISHTEKDGKTFANVDSVMGLPKGMPEPKATSIIVYDLDSPDAKDSIVMLPEWLQKVIKSSETWKEMTASTERPWSKEDDMVGDDDLPFA